MVSAFLIFSSLAVFVSITNNVAAICVRHEGDSKPTKTLRLEHAQCDGGDFTESQSDSSKVRIISGTSAFHQFKPLDTISL